jgi:hypothetical protein
LNEEGRIIFTTSFGAYKVWYIIPSFHAMTSIDVGYIFDVILEQFWSIGFARPKSSKIKTEKLRHNAVRVYQPCNVYSWSQTLGEDLLLLKEHTILHSCFYHNY